MRDVKQVFGEFDHLAPPNLSSVLSLKIFLIRKWSMHSKR